VTIWAVTGEPGGGKTLYAVGHFVLRFLREKRKVITNIPLNRAALEAVLGFDLRDLVEVFEDDETGAPYFSKVEHYKRFETWRAADGRGPVFIIDECHAVLKLAGFQSKVDDELADWFAKHRKKGADIVVITQALTGIPAAIRQRVAHRDHFKKAAFIGLLGWYHHKQFTGGDNKAISGEFGRYPKTWFGLYQSVDVDVVESIPKQKNILFRWQSVAMVSLLLLAFLYIGKTGLHFPKFGSAPAAAKNGSAGENVQKSDLDVSAPLAAVREPGEKGPEVEEAEDLVDVARAQNALVAVQRKRPGAFELDGAMARIGGSISMDGLISYLVMVDAPGQRRRTLKNVDWEQYGYRLVQISPCVALLEGPHGNYSLLCDEAIRFGHDGRWDTRGRRDLIPAPKS
jgi:zona occludens toxin (predicted ATPase)